MPNPHQELARTTDFLKKIRKKETQEQHKGFTEVATDDAMPSGSVLLVELLLDILGDVLLHTVLLDCLSPPKQKDTPFSSRIVEHRTPTPNNRHPSE